MRKLLIFAMLISLFFGCSTMYYNKTPMPLADIDEVYKKADLEPVLDRDVFQKAMTGYSRIRSKNENVISIIDFSKPSTEKRYYLIDLANKTLLYNTYTSHGVNTGEDMALSFSNKEGSRKSSLGFYLTAETYEGKHGKSLKLDGLERGFNHRARKRYIVIHSADYVTDGFIKENGRLGRSWGCPALPPDQTQEIIEKIKNGSVLFIYAKDDDYLNNSKLLR